MKPRRIPDLRQANVNLTPLIDVVLCLVIFFMIAARIGVSAGSDPSIQLPVTQIGRDLPSHGNILILNVSPSPSGDYPAVSALVDRSERTPRPIPLFDPRTKHNPLELILSRLHQRNPTMKIIIRADENMPYADLQPVLQACAKANISSVEFGTRK